MNTKKDQVRAKIVEVFPEKWSATSEITLAHVLRVLNSLDALYYNIRPYYPSSIKFVKRGKLMAIWELEKSFDDQEEEVYEFLHTIIC